MIRTSYTMKEEMEVKFLTGTSKCVSPNSTTSGSTALGNRNFSCYY